MIDALLHAVVEAVRGAGLDYDSHNCRIMPSGSPAPDCGAVFLAVHQSASNQDMMNAKNDYYGFFLTLTLRVSDVPIDRIGDTRLAVELADATGFNRRCDQLAALLHMDWGVLQDANQNLVVWN